MATPTAALRCMEVMRSRVFTQPGPEADMGLVPAAILLLVHIDQGAGLLSEQFTFRKVICTGGSSRHWISTFAALITARHRSTSSCMYLDVFAIEPPKISAESFLR